MNICRNETVADIVTLNARNIKIFEFANSIDSDEAAHYELPHLDLLCFLSILCILRMI